MTPFPQIVSPGAAARAEYVGLTLRDWFAGRAMQGMIASDPSGAIEGDFAWQGPTHHEQLAQYAYLIADAMIAQRNK